MLGSQGEGRCTSDLADHHLCVHGRCCGALGPINPIVCTISSNILNSLMARLCSSAANRSAAVHVLATQRVGKGALRYSAAIWPGVCWFTPDVTPLGDAAAPHRWLLLDPWYHAA